ncbi:MAG: hypothetical protein IPP29_11020 [Bacteroidetes bacterium]|nr:hypothetical protein [Bacteroidota bacterium]
MWFSERDRELSFSNAANFLKSVDVNQTSICIDIDLGTTLAGCSKTSQDAYVLSDCFSITRNTIDVNDQILYAGIAEGAGENQGRGFVMKLDPNGDPNTWNRFGTGLVCGTH